MSATGSWVDDEHEFEAEVRRALTTTHALPAVPGYRGLFEIARGGQGVVYAAFQQSTRRTVALKVLRDAPDRGVERRRFEREVELAASLQHPNVVALHDSGTADDGRPFLAMELVDGPTIEFAPAVVAARDAGLRRPALDALVATFAQVCEGVACAHRRGVVHRDLKPSNIRIDAGGTPKVLDFGLAKDLTGSGRAPELTVGSAGATFLGSLPWASPEQARGAVAEIDVRSDVYALGVVLYQLLARRFPYDVESDLKTALDQIVHAAPTPLRQVLPAVDRDLETIVATCLQKEPDRRYQSAAELAADLRRWAAGEVIEARRDSVYALRATARRHRGTVVAAALVLVSLVGGLAAALVLWQRADAERTEAVVQARRAEAATARADAERTEAVVQARRAEAATARADAERAEAVAQAKRAEAAMQFVSDTLVAVDPDRDGPDARVLDMVLRAVDDLPNRFADDPDTRTFFHVKLVELLRNLGALPRALALAEEAAAFATARYGPRDARTVFARANRAAILHAMGRSAEVVPELEELAAIVREDPAAYRSAGRHVFSNLGNALLAVDRIDDAARVLECNAFDTGEPPEPHLAANAYDNRAAIAGYRGDHAEAIRLLRLALSIREAAYGHEHSSTLRTRSNLAFYLAEDDQLDEAEQLAREDLGIRRHRFGARDPGTLTALNNHANYLERLDRFDEAWTESEECLEGRLAVLGETHPHTLITMGNLANLAARRHDWAAAEERFRRVIELSAQVRGAQHTDTLILRNNLASALRGAGRADDAIAVLREVVADAERALGPESFQTALFRGNLGRDLWLAGHPDEAEPALRESLRVLAARSGPDAPATKTMRGHLAALLRGTGRAAEADALER